MRYEIRLSSRAQRELSRLDRPTQQRMKRRLNQLAEDPFDPRLSKELVNQGGLRSSRIGGWRIIFEILEKEIVLVLLIERRGQVYQRI